MSRFAWLIPSRSKLRQKEKSFASAIPRVLNSIFWFLVLASWLPLLAGFENIISQLDPFSCSLTARVEKLPCRSYYHSPRLPS
jgi:hypothetical protein